MGLASLAAEATPVSDLGLIVLRLGSSARRAVERPVGEIIGSQLIERGEVLIDDEICPELLAASGAATLLIEHQLRKLDPGQPAPWNGLGEGAGHDAVLRLRRGVAGNVSPAAQRASISP